MNASATVEDLGETHKQDQQAWDDRWISKKTPFDKGEAHKAFTRLLESVSAGDASLPFELPKQGKALIPGCGRGYDVEALSRLGLDSTGIEVSSKAVEAANIWLETQGSPKNESDGMTQRNQAKKEVELGDFFTWDQAGSRGGYDVFYDYTFLCALPPSLRTSWAETYTRLSLPHSFLITLQFPLDDERTDGPPYSLSRSIYQDLLGADWEEVWGRDATEDESVGGSGGPVFRKGRERLAVWKKRS